MNSIFLRAKHWQLFIALIAIPFTTMILFSVIVAVVMINKTPEKPEDAIWIAYFMPFFFAISGFVQFGWLWNVLTKLRKLIPEGTVKMPAKRIKVFFFVPVIYFCLIPLFVAFVISNVSDQNPAGIIKVVIAGFFVFFLHLFSVFCIFHTFYFVAKTIRAAELQRNVSFSDFTGDFFLTWFFPIGVWFLQPRINKLIQTPGKPTDLNAEIIDSFN